MILKTHGKLNVRLERKCCLETWHAICSHHCLLFGQGCYSVRNGFNQPLGAWSTKSLLTVCFAARYARCAARVARKLILSEHKTSSSLAAAASCPAKVPRTHLTAQRAQRLASMTPC